MILDNLLSVNLICSGAFNTVAPVGIHLSDPCSCDLLLSFLESHGVEEHTLVAGPPYGTDAQASDASTALPCQSAPSSNFMKCATTEDANGAVTVIVTSVRSTKAEKAECSGSAHAFRSVLTFFTSLMCLNLMYLNTTC